MTMQLFLLNLALNILTMAIPIGFAVYLAVRLANKEKFVAKGKPLTLAQIQHIIQAREIEKNQDAITSQG